jgi:sulfotransferase|tara:strand:+ start:4383 stop:5195 length:813 start_codon:yes stop_codon:yes gene_type:complete
MNKKYFFITGLPRSGNTLLSSLLNQNPDITATGNSIVPEILYRLEEIKKTKVYKNFPDQKSLDNINENVFKNYFKHLKTKYIIDRGPWGSEYNFEMLNKYLNDKIKIIVLVRSIPEILMSFINLANNNSNFYLNKSFNELVRSETWRDKIEQKCRILMREDHAIDKGLYEIKYLLDNVNNKNYKIFEYDDLISNPETYLKKVYDFLKIPFYKKHYFKNLKQLKINNVEYDDSVYGGPLHTITTKSIVKEKKKVLDKILQRYSNMEFWRDN